MCLEDEAQATAEKQLLGEDNRQFLLEHEGELQQQLNRIVIWNRVDMWYLHKQLKNLSKHSMRVALPTRMRQIFPPIQQLFLGGVDQASHVGMLG